LSVQALLRQPQDSILNAGLSDDEDDDDYNGNEIVVENVATLEPFLFDTPGGLKHFSINMENKPKLWILDFFARRILLR
jgi:hypothetical protein